MQAAQPGMRLAGAASSAEEAAHALGSVQADVVLVDADDVTVPGALLAVGAVRVLALTGQDTSRLDRLVYAGAQGLLRKDGPPERVLQAIRKVHDGELWLERGAFRRLLEGALRQGRPEEDPDRQRIATLTARERQTIATLAGNVSVPSKVVAARLSISEHTLRNHLTSIYDKLHVRNRLELYAYATRHGLAEEQKTPAAHDGAASLVVHPVGRR